MLSKRSTLQGVRYRDDRTKGVRTRSTGYLHARSLQAVWKRAYKRTISEQDRGQRRPDTQTDGSDAGVELVPCNKDDKRVRCDEAASGRYLHCGRVSKWPESALSGAYEM